MKKALIVFVAMAVLAAFADNPHITQLIELTDVALSSPANGDIFTFDSASAKWVNRPAAEGPKIVARFDQDGIVIGDPHFSLFTPSADGMYRITDTADAPNTSGGVNYSDSFGSPLATIDSGNVYPVSGGFQRQHIVNVRLHAGNTIFIDSTVVTLRPFNLHIVVEKL